MPGFVVLSHFPAGLLTFVSELDFGKLRSESEGFRFVTKMRSTLEFIISDMDGWNKMTVETKSNGVLEAEGTLDKGYAAGRA